jgi:predicted ABC-type ATPase
MEKPTLWIVAGPNGVGKTTYAFRHIQAVTGSTRFVNLDEIARGLSPLDPKAGQRRAARTALSVMDDMILEKASFSIETTLAGRTHLGLLTRAAHAGFRVNLLFFAVRSVDISRARIARRVSEGGHDVPEDDLVRRFGRSQANFRVYADKADLWRVFDNNGATPITAAEGRRGCVALINGTSGLPDTIAETIKALPACPEV